MSFCKTRARRQGVLVIWIFGALLGSSHAQPQPKGTADQSTALVGVTAPRTEAEIKRSTADGLRLFTEGKDDAAEAILSERSSRKTQDSEWHLEQVAQLLRILSTAQEGGDPKTAQRVARRILRHLDSAERKAGQNAALLANVSSLRGFIQERFTGDSNEAVKDYQKARKLNLEKTEQAKGTTPTSVPTTPSVISETK